MHTRDPGVRGAVGAVRIIGPDPGQVGNNDLVRVFLELAGQLVAQSLPASLTREVVSGPVDVAWGAGAL